MVRIGVFQLRQEPSADLQEGGKLEDLNDLREAIERLLRLEQMILIRKREDI